MEGGLGRALGFGGGGVEGPLGRALGFGGGGVEGGLGRALGFALGFVERSPSGKRTTGVVEEESVEVENWWW